MSVAVARASMTLHAAKQLLRREMKAVIRRLSKETKEAQTSEVQQNKCDNTLQNNLQ